MGRVKTFTVAAAVLGALAATSCLIDFEAHEPVEDPWPCGDGVVQTGEECDDGNPANGDGCDTNCRTTGCGNGVRTDPEQCDDGNLQSGDSCDSSCVPTAFDLVDDIGRHGSDGFFLRPAVGTTLVDGESQFVVAWVERASGKRQVAMRVHGTSGNPTQPRRVLSQTGDAKCVNIASNHLGQAVIVWVTETPQDSNQHDTHYVVVEPGGSPRAGGELSVPGSEESTYEGCPAVAAAETGEFCILWARDNGNERSFCLDATANAAGTPQELGESRQNVAWARRAIWGYEQGFIAQWVDPTNDELVAQELDEVGAAIGTPFVISATPTPLWVGNGFSWGDGQFISAVGINNEFGQSEALPRFLFRRFDAPDSPEAQEDFVTDDHYTQNAGRLVGHDNGRHLAIWFAQGFNAAATGCNLQAQEFDATGQQVGELLELVPGAPAKCGRYPEGAVTPEGDVMMVWSLYDADNESLPMRLQGVAYPRMLN